MGVLDFFYRPTQPDQAVNGEGKKDDPESSGSLIKPHENGTAPATSLSTSNSAVENASDAVATSLKVSSPSVSPTTSPHANDPDNSKPPSAQDRRFSFRSLAVIHGSQRNPMLSTEEDHQRKAQASAALSKFLAKPVRISGSDKRAKESALILRSIIVGPMFISPTASKPTKAVSKPRLSKIKAQLMQPKSANKVIAQLRALPVTDVAVSGKVKQGGLLVPQPPGPIHAVCLEWTEEVADRNHFVRHLTKSGEVVDDQFIAQSLETPSVAMASIATLTEMFRDMQIVSLITVPDLGLGQPGDGKGILAGAVPTAETVIQGVQQITPQLMALGYATSRAVLPDHHGVYPPTDRLSVLTYWWGLELVLPPPTLEYLASTQSISSTVINFLTALSVVNNGIREILPFVRYIAQFIDFEFNAIQSQNKGQGVICAATWVMPAALIPRPWDFPSADGTTDGNETSTTSVPAIFLPPIQIPSSIPKVIITSPTSTTESVPPDVRIALRS